MMTMTDTISVLVIEDEESFIEALVVGLKREGFLVTVARDGIEGLELFDRSRPDLILLDLWLPKKSGIDVCREIRTRSRIPIIMVTAKSSEIDTVVGLEVGADDYVTKPFRLRELVARMRAVMRRSAGTEDTALTGELMDIDGLSLDPERHEVRLDGELVPLPLKEFELLEMLMGNAGRVLTRETLIDRIWGPNYVGDTKTLDVHIKRLRAKVEEDPSRPARITTVRGLGYKFEVPRRA
jgi:two-component system response regulator RegX3